MAIVQQKVPYTTAVQPKVQIAAAFEQLKAPCASVEQQKVPDSAAIEQLKVQQEALNTTAEQPNFQNATADHQHATKPAAIALSNMRTYTSHAAAKK